MVGGAFIVSDGSQNTTITLDEIIARLRVEVESLPSDGRVEVSIHKSQNALMNPEIHTVKRLKGKVTIN